MTTATHLGPDYLRRLVEDQRELPPPQVRQALRKARNISTGDLAQTIGVTPQCIRYWETGRRTPRGELLTRYIEALRVLRDAP